MLLRVWSPVETLSGESLFENMADKLRIVEFLSQATRNRLVFCHEHIDGLLFTNVGKVLAESLKEENLRSQMVAYAAEDFLAEILSSTRIDSVIGKYVALENIGILFEPELGFNLKSTLDNASTNKTIIICSDAFIKKNRLYFLQEGDNYTIDLNGLSFIEI